MLESFTISGDRSRGQDADFILEEVNKETKSWLARGVPSDDMWQTVCRNLDGLKSIKKKMKDMTGTRTTEIGYRQLDIDDSVQAWRCRLQESNYLTGTTQSTSDTHTSIIGKPLHKDLSKFRILAEGKRSNRIASTYMGSQEKPEDTHPVYVNAEEEQKFTGIEGKTVKELRGLIASEITNSIDDEGDQAYFLSKYRQARKKVEFVSLLLEIQAYGQ